MKKQASLKKSKLHNALLVSVSGADNAYSLSLYNLKSYCFGIPHIKHQWNIDIIQQKWINKSNEHLLMHSFLENIESKMPADVVGFSCYMWGMPYIEEAIDFIKSKYPNTLIVLGGPEISSDWIAEGKYNSLNADLLVYGEGEVAFAFATILDRIMNNEDNYNINNVAFKNSLNKFILSKQSKSKFNFSLSKMKSPYLSGVVDDATLTIEGIQANIETQRGCSLRCTYCIYHKDMPKILYRNIEDIISEVVYCSNKGVKLIRFTDANFCSDIDFAKIILKGLIEHKIESTLMMEIIPGFMDEEFADLMAQYNDLYEWNYITIGIGVQSINHPTLKLVRRGIRIAKFDQTFDLLKSKKIYAKIDIIIGLPNENLEMITNTQEYMLKKLNGSKAHLLCCHVLRGIPGTELTKTAEAYGMSFSSVREPYELIESPALPRSDMLIALRRTAVIFRLINLGFSQGEIAKNLYFQVVDQTGLSHIEVIDILINGLMNVLPDESWFKQNDFPYAETWWWEKSSSEVKDEMMVKILKHTLHAHQQISYAV